MRIVDCFTDVILYARKLSRGEITVESADEAREKLVSLFEKAKQLAQDNGMSEAVFDAGKYPVAAFIDELFLCSDWEHKRDWKKEPLQRLFFNTSNAGAEFYERMSELNKFGPDRDIREIYALCMGLGFRGKYFRGEDRQKYEEVKAFNLSLLLPDEAQRNIDSATLFPFAYRGHTEEKEHGFKPRMNIYPVIIGVPVAVLLVLALVYHFNIASTLNQIQQLIQY